MHCLTLVTDISMAVSMVESMGFTTKGMVASPAIVGRNSVTLKPLTRAPHTAGGRIMT